MLLVSCGGGVQSKFDVLLGESPYALIRPAYRGGELYRVEVYTYGGEVDQQQRVAQRMSHALTEIASTAIIKRVEHVAYSAQYGGRFDGMLVWELEVTARTKAK